MTKSIWDFAVPSDVVTTRLMTPVLPQFTVSFPSSYRSLSFLSPVVGPDFGPLTTKVPVNEMGIFRRLGMTPVLFGQTIVGRNLPSQAYMLTFDDLASHEKLWRNFGGDPEWQKLRARAGLSDAENVSNITNAVLSPLPFSPIR
jgi:hypothetical protein